MVVAQDTTDPLSLTIHCAVTYNPHMPKNREPLPDFADVQVRLKPVLGVAPGLYLAVLYAFALAALLFFVFVFPGLRANGTRVSFATHPAGAGVWVDGRYLGATPCEGFVAAGERTVELRKAFYKTTTTKQKFAGRVLGSLFFPRRATVRSELPVSDPQGLASWSAGQVAQWGLLREFSPAYPLPPLLRESVGSLARLRTPDGLARARALLLEGIAAVDSEAELREAIAAAGAYAARGALLTPPSVVRLVREGAAFARGAASLPSWAVLALDPDDPLRARLLALPQMGAHAQRALATARAYEAVPPVAPPLGPMTIAGIRFLPVPGGVQIVGRPAADAAARLDAYLPVPVRVDPFLLGETEVTRDQYAQFLAAEPRWADRMALLRDGLVTGQYLDGWDGARFPAGTGNLPVVGVSRHAAAAFCAWLTTRLPGGMTGYAVRLPSEAEWQRAAAAGPAEDAVFLAPGGALKAAGASRPGRFGHRDLWGNAWEWTRDAYLPMRNLLSPLDPAAPDPLAALSGAEAVVKGGSWANSREDFGSFVRGSQPPDWCTPYTGFRAAITRGTDTTSAPGAHP
jgi:gamma-glutamyl hercynylcysteine S-oxide synthase